MKLKQNHPFLMYVDSGSISVHLPLSKKVRSGVKAQIQLVWLGATPREELHARAEHKPLEAVMKRRKWRWPPTSVTRIALDWNKQGMFARESPGGKGVYYEKWIRLDLI